MVASRKMAEYVDLAVSLIKVVLGGGVDETPIGF